MINIVELCNYYDDVISYMNKSVGLREYYYCCYRVTWMLLLLRRGYVKIIILSLRYVKTTIYFVELWDCYI